MFYRAFMCFYSLNSWLWTVKVKYVSLYIALSNCLWHFLPHLKRDSRAKRCSSIKTIVAMIKLRIGLWIDYSSTLFSGFGPVWLLSVPKLKNLARWEEILVKWGSHCRRQWVFCRLRDSLLRMTIKRELCVLSGWNLAWKGSKSGSFEMSRHQMDCSAISWKFTKLIKWPMYIYIYIYSI